MGNAIRKIIGTFYNKTVYTGTIYFQNIEQNTKNEVLDKLVHLSNDHKISPNGSYIIIDYDKLPNHFSVEISGLPVLLRGENGCIDNIKGFLFDAEKYLKHKNIVFESMVVIFPN